VWLTKPVYEILPYFYMAAGVVSLVASAYINYWYWPTIGLIVGLGCLIAGMVVWLKRKDYRRNEEEYGGDSRKLDES